MSVIQAIGVLVVAGVICAFSAWWGFTLFMRDVCYVTGWWCR